MRLRLYDNINVLGPGRVNLSRPVKHTGDDFGPWPDNLVEIYQNVGNDRRLGSRQALYVKPSNHTDKYRAQNAVRVVRLGLVISVPISLLTVNVTSRPAKYKVHPCTASRLWNRRWPKNTNS